MINDTHRSRMKGLFVWLVLVWLVLLARLVLIQIVQSPVLVEEARRNHERRERIPPDRGDILDRDLVPLARTVSAHGVSVVPDELPPTAETLASLTHLVGADPEFLRERVRLGSPFFAVRSLLPTDPRLRALRSLAGVRLEPERARVHPQGRLAAHVVGFAGVDHCGLEGIELEFNTVLSGVPGWAILARDARGRGHSLPGEFFRPPRDGDQVVLTIDTDCQAIVEEELGRAVEETGARAGSVIIMDPRTGDVVALANHPTYDPNRLDESPAADLRNRAITDMFEPGSTFKIVTLAAAIRHGVVEPAMLLDAGEGTARFEGYTIRDHHPYGEITFREAVEHSSNICFAKVAHRMSAEDLYQMARDFGLGCPTGIRLPGESGGLLRAPSKWSGRSLGTIAIGQEIGVTALQLASAACAIANGGVLMTPRIALGVRDRQASWLSRFPPRPIRRVLTAEEARSVTDYLVGVVERGTGVEARLPGLPVAGKTGTAQKADAGGYIEGQYVASFVGYLPAHDPIVVILVVLDEPEGEFYGGEVAAPVFRRIVQRMMTTRGARLGEELVRWQLDRDPNVRFASLGPAAASDGTGGGVTN